MESISTKKLPPIFKLSLLSKILPYFGYLHDWKMILESINKKTNDIWEENKEVLKYWGRDLKLSLHLEESSIKFSENIMLKAELFKFQTKRFFEFHLYTKKTIGLIKELKIDSLILQLCSQLNEDNAIVFQKWGDVFDEMNEIFLQTRKEIAEMIPSSKCTSSILEIKIFEDSQAQDLWKYIADSIELKRVIVKKNENNTFEVDSITSHHYLDWKDYNILNEKVKERLDTYYSCPVSNCICEPKILWLDHEHLNEKSEELIDEIWGLSLLENAHWLKVIGNVEAFSEINYLSRIKQQFPKLEILFDFQSWRCIKGIRLERITTNSRLITLVTKGEERIFHISGDNKWLVDKIVDLHFNEKENIAIINWGWIALWNAILQTNSKSEIKDQRLIDKLKKKTRSENSQYIIVDTSKLELQANTFQIEKYTTIAKYFKFINIDLNQTNSKYKIEIEEINKLSKQWSIRIQTKNIQDFVNSDALNLINQDFNQIIVESRELKFKLIKSNSRSRERMFTVFESLLYKTQTADIRELREMISKKYE